MKTGMSWCVIGAVLAFLAASAQAEKMAEGKKMGDRPGLAEMDKDGNGAVSKEEFAAHAAVKSEAWFKKLDANGDGAVVADELVGPNGKKMGPPMSLLDTNSDGKASKEEVLAFRAKQTEAMFAKRDANGNGSLSAEELAAMSGHEHKDKAEKKHGDKPKAPEAAEPAGEM